MTIKIKGVELRFLGNIFQEEKSLKNHIDFIHFKFGNSISKQKNKI